MRKYPVAWFYILAFCISWIGALNIFGGFIPGVSPIAYALLNCVVAIALIAVFGKVNLSRREKVCAG